jgi:sec-independent protein translocase protein TatA
MGNIGVSQLLLILLIVLVLFGAKKIPELARGLGLGLKEFRKATKESDGDDAKAASELSVEEKPKIDGKNS